MEYKRERKSWHSKKKEKRKGKAWYHAVKAGYHSFQAKKRASK